MAAANNEANGGYGGKANSGYAQSLNGNAVVVQGGGGQAPCASLCRGLEGLQVPGIPG